MATIPEGEMQFEIGEIKPQKWEYQVQTLRDFPLNRIEEILESYGADEWELAAVDDGIAYFKRPIWSD